MSARQNQWEQLAEYYPELRSFDDDADRRRVYWRAQFTDLSWRRVRRLLLAFVLIGLTIGLARELSSRYFGLHGIWGSGLGGMIAGLLGSNLMIAGRPAVRAYFRDELAKRGIPICEFCGYDLRGQTEPRCPECGKSSVLRNLS